MLSDSAKEVSSNKFYAKSFGPNEQNQKQPQQVLSILHYQLSQKSWLKPKQQLNRWRILKNGWFRQLEQIEDFLDDPVVKFQAKSIKDLELATAYEFSDYNRDVFF